MTAPVFTVASAAMEPARDRRDDAGDGLPGGLGEAAAMEPAVTGGMTPPVLVGVADLPLVAEQLERPGDDERKDHRLEVFAPGPASSRPRTTRAHQSGYRC